MYIIESLYKRIVEDIILKLIFTINGYVEYYIGNYHLYILSAISILLILFPIYLISYFIIKFYRYAKGINDKIKLSELLFAPLFPIIFIIGFINNWLSQTISDQKGVNKLFFYSIRFFAILFLIIIAGLFIVFLHE